MRILIVSEKKYEIRQIREHIEHLPFKEFAKDTTTEIFEETGSKNAYDLIATKLKQSFTFDLVIASHRMKLVTGFQLAEKIHKLESDKFIPVVVFGTGIIEDAKNEPNREIFANGKTYVSELPITFDGFKNVFSSIAETLVQNEDQQRKEAIENLLSYRDTNDFLSTMENLYMLSARKVINYSAYAPWSPIPLLSLGRIYIGSNMYDTAIPYLKRAINLDFSLKDAHKNLAICYKKLGQAYEELEELKQLLKSSPQSSSVLFKVGDAYLRESNYEKAAEYFKKAIASCKPDDGVRHKARIHVGLGNAYVKEGDFKKDISKYTLAEGEFKTAISVDPTLLAAYNSLVITYKKLGQEELAKEAMQKAISIMPDSSEGWISLFEIYLIDGEYDKAKFSLQKAIKYDPENQIILCIAGETYARQNMLQEAIELFEKAIDINPSDLRLYNYIGICYRRLNDIGMAIEYYQKALKIDDKDPNIHYNLGRAYQQGSNNSRAEKSYKKALDLQPDFSEAKNALENLAKFPATSNKRKSVR